ncbi:succinylglutamate desuccinylase/aspartoacylase family protein [bacterium]|nr:succinylglutamate desuccinylase/aspartoacylase family protein [bacterium]
MIRKLVILALLSAACFISGGMLLSQHQDETLYPTPSLTKRMMLSDYFSVLRGGDGDTEVFEYCGDEGGGTVLILGGTHCDEPASYLAAYLLIETLDVQRGRVLIVPRANRSALTHNLQGEGHPQTFEVETLHGKRSFRMGSRYTNPLNQWPDPEVYLHSPSKQELSGSDSRNLNRCYPGRADGTYTERVAHALAELIKQEKVDLVIDLHEASPEYPVINAIVAHERAMDCAAFAVMELQGQGLEYSLEPSPQNYHGLSHRELGDHTNALATLMESANASQGRLRGRTDAQLVVTGRDKMYTRAAEIEMTRVPFGLEGIPLDIRVARHIEGTRQLVLAFNGLNAGKEVEFGGAPTYAEIVERGFGKFMHEEN